jgi:hypothetical protein
LPSETTQRLHQHLAKMDAVGDADAPRLPLPSIIEPLP